MCVNYYSYLTTNQADVQPGWAKKDRFDSSNTTLSKIKNHVVKNYFSKLFKYERAKEKPFQAGLKIDFIEADI